METTFEKLNDQEMVNVVGGDRILAITDKYGNVWYIIVKEEEVPENPTLKDSSAKIGRKLIKSSK